MKENIIDKRILSELKVEKKKQLRLRRRILEAKKVKKNSKKNKKNSKKN